MTSPPPLLEARGLAHRFGALQVLGGITLTAARGEVVGLVGPNGSGKTTALRILHRELVPEAGRVLLEGEDLRQLHKSGRVDQQLVIQAMIQTCEALAEAHALGIVHRDIKPANLFVVRELDGSPFIKLLDFGIAKMQEPGAMLVRLLGALERS